MPTTQIVITRLKDIGSRDHFLDLTRDMLAWLEQQPGFLDYALYENGIDFSDTLVYRSDADASRINEDFGKTETYRAMIQLVEPGYRGFFGRQVIL